jgi:hypothetical protein
MIPLDHAAKALFGQLMYVGTPHNACQSYEGIQMREISVEHAILCSKIAMYLRMHVCMH